MLRCFCQHVQNGHFLGISHQFAGIIGRHPVALRHHLAHPHRCPLGLQNADVERQIRTSQEFFNHITRLAQALVDLPHINGFEFDSPIFQQGNNSCGGGSFDNIGNCVRSQILASRHCRLTTVIPHPQDRLHVPSIQGRCLQQEGQGNGIFVSNDRKNQIGMQVFDVGKFHSQYAPHHGIAVGCNLEQNRYHLITLNLRAFRTGNKGCQLSRQRHAGFRITTCQNGFQNTDIKTNFRL